MFEGALFGELRDLSSSKYSSQNDPDLSFIVDTKTPKADASQNYELEFKLIRNSSNYHCIIVKQMFREGPDNRQLQVLIKIVCAQTC